MERQGVRPPERASRGRRQRRPAQLNAAGAALAGVVALAAVLRFATLGEQSYWADEAHTARMLERGLRATAEAIRNTESAPPLYYGVAWGWTRVAGTSEFGLRALSALAGTMVVPAVYLAGRELVSRRAGLAAALLAAVSPPLVWYSQEARAYSLFTLLAALSLAFFARARRQPSALDVGGWAATSALALATHYFAVFLVVPELVLLLLARRHDRRLLAAAPPCSRPVSSWLLWPTSRRRGRTAGHSGSGRCRSTSAFAPRRFAS